MRQKSYAENSRSNLEDVYFLMGLFLILEKEDNNTVNISVSLVISPMYLTQETWSNCLTLNWRQRIRSRC